MRNVHDLLTARSMLAATALIAAAVATLPAPAEAGSRRCYERRDGRVVCREAHADRRSAQEREWERDRANHYDPTGSYASYPDWARYALSPKSNR